MTDQTLLGKIVNSHGLDGSLKLYPYTSHLDQFQKGMTLYLGQDLRAYKVVRARTQKGMVYLDLEGVTSRNQADELRDLEVYIPKSSRRDLEANEFFIEDLIGFDVYDLDQWIGRLERIQKGLANDVYWVKGPEKTYAIPGVKAFIKDIDLENKRISVHIIEGMDDL